MMSELTRIKNTNVRYVLKTIVVLLLFNQFCVISKAQQRDSVSYAKLKAALIERDSAQQHILQSHLLRIRDSLEIEKKIKTNSLLELQNAVAAKKIQRKTIGIALMGISLLLLSGICYFLYGMIAKRKKHLLVLENARHMLQSNMEQLRMLNHHNEARALRTQMNPHFLFNCLSALQNCILTEDIALAEKYVDHLNPLLTSLLQISPLDYVSLENEIDVVQQYVALENLRFQPPVSLSIINNTFSSTQIPPLLLQPFIENCFVHAFAAGTPDQEIAISLHDHTDYVECQIMDNGRGISKMQVGSHQSKALHIAQQRLALMNHKKVIPNGEFITIASTPVGDGTMVKILVPKL